MNFKKIFRSVLIQFIIILLVSPIISATIPEDIDDHGSRQYITKILDEEIMTNLTTDNFEPNKEITRGDFSYSLAKQMQLLPINKDIFSDLKSHDGHRYINALIEENIINGYPDDTFRPENTINRAEAISILIKSLDIKENEEKINLTDIDSFIDISEDHWAYDEITIAKEIGLLDNLAVNYFNPEYTITRAEAAELLYHINQLDSGKGYLSDYYPTTNRVSINTEQGQRLILNLNDNTRLGRNNRLVEIEEIQSTDEIFFIFDDEDELIYLKAYGMVSTEDLSTEVSRMTYGMLEPNEIESLAGGNYDFLGPKMLNSIQEFLLEQGLTAAEVEAIMNTQWDQLEELSKNRLTEAIAIQTGLPLDITRALMDGDWERIRTYGQVELFQRVVQEILTGNLIS